MFCTKHGIKPLPASQLTLRYFCTELSYLVSYATIRVYLAGIRLFHIENHFPDPTTETPLLHYLCNGIHRCTGDKKLKRRPITISLLRSIKLELSRDFSLHPHDKLLYWAAFTLAFYGFLRASEYTSPTHRHYDQSRHLLCQDITLNHNSMKVHIKASKTDQYRQSAVVLISRTGTSTCPLNPMDKFLKQSNCRKSSPLFTFRNGKYLTRQDVSSMTKSLLYLVGANPALYSSHSYRIGAATTAAAAGISESFIQTLRRWQSTSYKTYIRSSPEMISTRLSLWPVNIRTTELATPHTFVLIRINLIYYFYHYSLSLLSQYELSLATNYHHHHYSHSIILTWGNLRGTIGLTPTVLWHHSQNAMLHSSPSMAKGQ